MEAETISFGSLAEILGAGYFSVKYTRLANAVLAWIQCVEWHYLPPVKPFDGGLVSTTKSGYLYDFDKRNCRNGASHA